MFLNLQQEQGQFNSPQQRLAVKVGGSSKAPNQEVKMMTLERLNQYRHLAAETNLLKKRLVALTVPCFADAVQAFTPGSGDTLRKAPVYSDTAREELMRRYHCRLQRLLIERDALESYIEQIEDSYLRQIITLRFVEGFRWQRVADVVGGSEDSVRKACERAVSKSKKLSDMSVF